MIIGIDGAMRDYAWGSPSAIAELLGRTPSGGPEAELWLGAHPGSPSTAAATVPGHAGERLDDLLAADPDRLLGAGRTRLPFLMKVLAADAPLSLQVHPDAEQAREGFRREEEAGVPRDDPARNYVDDNHKPELILALSPTFEALAGFRKPAETRMLLNELVLFAPAEHRRALTDFAARLTGEDDAAELEGTVEWLLGGGEDAAALVGAVVAAAPRAAANSSFAREWRTVVDLDAAYPGDPGVVLSMLLNRVSLRQGQALGLPAGSLHAYLSGLGIEVMAASDDVLRGGLTKKHVDVPELLRIVRFEALPSPIITPDEPQPGVLRFRPAADDFELLEVGVGDAAEVHGYRLAGPEKVTLPLTGPAVVLCTVGGAVLESTTASLSLARGDAALITADESPVTVSGSAILFLATTP